MTLPTNGSVVVIDEKPEEALPIIKALSKSGISTTYYTGIKDEEFPNEPSQIIRLAFLDLQLIDSVTDEHQIATSLIQVLKKIIPANNGPYILVVWSKNYAKYGAYVENEIKKYGNGIIPACIVRLNKSDCLDGIKVQNIDGEEFANDVTQSILGSLEEDEIIFLKQRIKEGLDNYAQFEFQAKDNAIAIIENAIETELKKAGVFHLFIIWENLLKKSGSNIVASISSAVEYSDLWEQNIRDVIKRMAKARTGQNETTNDMALKSSLITITNSFSEELESKIRESVFPEYINLESPYIIAGKVDTDTFEILPFVDNGPKVKLKKNGLDVKGKEKISYSKMNQLSEGLPEPDKTIVHGLTNSYIKVPYLINTKLHLELNPSDELIPGNVYKIEVPKDKQKEYLSNYFDTLVCEPADFIFIELEVSPICDYAQAKWKKSRLISGVIYKPQNFCKTRDHLYPVQPPVLIDGVLRKIVFDFHLFKSLDKNIVEGRQIWFRLKRELLLDIIANLSGHVNRPGIAFVS
jgi:hypothetical protein